VTPAIQAAVTEIEQAFPGHRIELTPENQGGAYVIVHDLAIGEGYIPATTWAGFLITFQYPYADVYPHFVRPDIKRINNTNLPQGFSGPTIWNEFQAIQVSRRSNRWKPGIDTAATKLAKVLDWIRNV